MSSKRTEQNRTRYRTVAFRVSEIEWKELHERIELCGRPKQDYLIESTLRQQLVVIGNRLLLERLDDKLEAVLAELRRIDCMGDIEGEMQVSLNTAIELLKGFTAKAE